MIATERARPASFGEVDKRPEDEAGLSPEDAGALRRSIATLPPQSPQRAHP